MSFRVFLQTAAVSEPDTAFSFVCISLDVFRAVIANFSKDNNCIYYKPPTSSTCVVTLGSAVCYMQEFKEGIDINIKKYLLTTYF